MADRFWPAPRVFVFNSVGSYVVRRQPEKNYLPGFIEVTSMVEMKSAVRDHFGKPMRLVFTPIGDRDFEHTEIFDDTLKFLADTKDTVIAVDEIWRFQTAAYCSRWQEDAYLLWRHARNPFMATAQQPQIVRETLRAMADHVYIGSFDTDQTKRAIAACGLKREWIEQLSTLPKFHFVHKYPDRTCRIEKA